MSSESSLYCEQFESEATQNVVILNECNLIVFDVLVYLKLEGHAVGDDSGDGQPLMMTDSSCLYKRPGLCTWTILLISASN